METVARAQTVLRLREETLVRARFKAKQKNMSLNAFLEQAVEAAVAPRIPKLPENFTIDPAIECVSGIMPAPSKEQLDADERLAYIYNKGL